MIRQENPKLVAAFGARRLNSRASDLRFVVRLMKYSWLKIKEF